jgi:hypothetical protein
MNYRSLILTALVVIACNACSSESKVSTYDLPGGLDYSSPDYTVSVEQNGVSHPSFVHYSFPLDENISLS